MKQSLYAAALVLAGGCADADRPAEQLRRAERALTLEVAPEPQGCMRMTWGECLLVRERPDGTWRPLPEGIEGFDYEPGFDYVVEVGRREVGDPPADGFDRAYRLRRVVEKTPTE